MQMFTIRERVPIINYFEPGVPIYQHWCVEAPSASHALALARKWKTNGVDPEVVPRL
jgi:hypothetical protein